MGVFSGSISRISWITFWWASVFFFKRYILFYICCEYFACMHACAPEACLAPWKSQKRSLDPLKQEFRMVVNHQAGAGNWACTVCENSNCSYLLSYYSGPLAGFLLLLLCMCTHAVPSTINRSQFSCSPPRKLGIGHRWPGLLSMHPYPLSHTARPSLVAFLASGGFSPCYLSLSQGRGRKRLKVNEVFHLPVQVLSSTK